METAAESTARLERLVERLALAGVDVEPVRCDAQALRLTAGEMLELADLLDQIFPAGSG